MVTVSLITVVFCLFEAVSYLFVVGLSIFDVCSSLFVFSMSVFVHISFCWQLHCSLCVFYYIIINPRITQWMIKKSKVLAKEINWKIKRREGEVFRAIRERDGKWFMCRDGSDILKWINGCLHMQTNVELWLIFSESDTFLTFCGWACV